MMFKGEWFKKGDPGYEAAAFGRIWNEYQPTDRLPDIVAIVEDVDDVVEAVKYARDHKLKVVVRGGGHNWVSPSLRKGGMLIDLGKLNKVVSIDKLNRRAVIEPILSNVEVMAALNEHGLAYPTGHCPTVKASGYLLSGGMSWNHGVWGAGVGSIEAIEMVTADGELITASANEHADLFWAMRGVGFGSFAICVRYHLRCYALPKSIHATSYIFAASDVVEIAKWLGAIADQIHPKVELSLWLLHNQTHGKIALITASTFANTPEEAKAAVELLEQNPLIDRCLDRQFDVPSSFPELFKASGDLWPEHLRNSVDAMFSDRPLDEVFSKVADHYQSCPSDLNVLMFAVYTGGHGPKPPTDSSFSITGRLYGGPWSMWKTQEEDEKNIAWHEKCVELLSSVIHGHYISESNTVLHPEYIETAYAPGVMDKIEAIRHQRDPEGRFFGFYDGL